MELIGLQCHGCGSSNVIFDSKRRFLTCNQCGKEEYYSRATLNSNGKVIFSKENAINFFVYGKFEKAQYYALEILNISKDNAPALFIMSYYDEFVLRKNDVIKKFFEEIKEIALEYDEVQDLKKLVFASAYNLSDYEIEIITLIATNMQSDEDRSDLGEFIDKICPFFISKRTSMDFLNKEHIEIYQELASYCNIPKTCFALLKAIEENPDSPFANNSFYLYSKTKYFYDNFVLQVGKIIYAMKNNEYKEKFINSFEQKRKLFEQNAKN